MGVCFAGLAAAATDVVHAHPVGSGELPLRSELASQIVKLDRRLALNAERSRLLPAVFEAYHPSIHACLMSPAHPCNPMIMDLMDYVKRLQKLADESRDDDSRKAVWDSVKDFVSGDHWQSSEEPYFTKAEVPKDLDPHLPEGEEWSEKTRAWSVIVEEQYHSIVKPRFNNMYWMMYGDNRRHLIHFLHDANGKLVTKYLDSFRELKDIGQKVFPPDDRFPSCCTSPIIEFAKKIELYTSGNLNPDNFGEKFSIKVTHQQPVVTLNGKVGPELGNTRKEFGFQICVGDDISEDCVPTASVAARGDQAFLVPFFSRPPDDRAQERFRSLTGSDESCQTFATRGIAFARVRDKHGDAFHQPKIARVDDLVKKLHFDEGIDGAEGGVLRYNPGSTEDLKRLRIAPDPTIFNPEVILRTLDLVDRTNYSVLVVIGTPSCIGDAKLENEQCLPPVPIGTCTRPPVMKEWNTPAVTAAAAAPSRTPGFPANEIGKYTVFHDIPDNALEHWQKDGAVLVDPRDGTILAVTLEILPTQPSSAQGALGGMRRKTAEAVVCEACCISLLKKHKPGGEDEKLKKGVVSIRSTRWAVPEINRGKIISRIEYSLDGARARWTGECIKIDHKFRSADDLDTRHGQQAT